MNEYLKQEILTSTPDQLFLMLLSKCLLYTRIVPVDIGKVLDVLIGLSSELNRDIENEFVSDLDGLLNFMIIEMTYYNITNEIARLNSVSRILAELIEAWKIRISN